ncbi:MAG: YpdA family putative bacillithiol disulfide reductase [Longimicrobiales bacterium]
MSRSRSTLDLAVVGAGPCGLAVGVAAHQAGLTCTLLDKGCITRSLTLYPRDMRFFSTAERLELGNVPFTSAADKPSRKEALRYYRRIVQHFELDVRQYEEVLELAAEPVAFRLGSRTRAGAQRETRARNVVIATGYFDTPNLLQIPGEDLANVLHYYQEPEPFFGQRCVVIGGGNSAVDAALELYRSGAAVHLVHFAGGLDPGVKPWVLPDIMNRIGTGEIEVSWRTRVQEIGMDYVVLRSEPSGVVRRLANDWVFAMTGYRNDPTLLRSVGVDIDPDTGKPVHDPETMETNVPGVFIAGVIAAGCDANKIFIENGRLHGGQIVDAIRRRVSAASA